MYVYAFSGRFGWAVMYNDEIPCSFAYLDNPIHMIDHRKVQM